MVGVTTSNPQFDKAAVEVKKLTKKPADEEKLKVSSGNPRLPQERAD
jgi:hypothetical protein